MVQGMPGSFFGIGLPALLREGGAGLDMVALAYLVWAPWALKWLWGPFLDGRPTLFNAVFGRLLHLPLIMASAFVLLVAFPPSGSAWPIFAVGIVCSFVGSTLQMVLARWIMAVEPDEKRRARLNATQVAGMITGAMVGGTLIVALSNLLSWTLAVLAIGVLIVLASLPFMLTQREHPSATVLAEHIPIGTASSIKEACRCFFERSGVGLLMVLMLMSDVATGVDVLLIALLVDSGYSAAGATFLLNTLALMITIPATFLTGQLLQRFEARSVLAVLLGSKGTVFLLLGVGVFPIPVVSAALSIAAIVIASAAAIAYWQIYMRFATTEHAASDIGMLTSIRTLFLMIGGIGAGQVSGLLGYSGIFSLAAAMALAAALLAILQGAKERETATP